jgi:succinylglutamate desuccinylase
MKTKKIIVARILQRSGDTDIEPDKTTSESIRVPIQDILHEKYGEDWWASYHDPSKIKKNKPKKIKQRIRLEYEDFVSLTKGDVITKDGVEIALADIGYYNMLEIIKNNMNE